MPESGEFMQTGRLYVVATPIGNLEDISARALRVLGAVSIIAAEDTRHSKRLLDHFKIPTPLTSYHDHNEREKSPHLLAQLQQGRDVALITDAGTPCIADPGYRIVRAAQEQGIPVIAVPGPSALIAALSVSGLPTDRFTFHGFFPRKQTDAGKVITSMRAAGGTHVVYESPQRLSATLSLIAQTLPDAEACVARELTKIHEEVVRGALAELAQIFSERDTRGECVLVMNIAEPGSAGISDDAILAAVSDAIHKAGMTRRDAIKFAAHTLGVPRNRVYDLAGDA
ncbi:MAG: 16S rRNA (cytidine(1402)-2'-O)-methyltransferase [Candidatus Hydrogenedentes bacterium]|nr:16S rRNA (cytidine(1402)-2'-O)-methyltransferase [Candidatus Hydrogenedentota bacterium]